MWQLSANYSSERGERKAFFFSLYLTLSWLSQHTCSPVRVWRYIMALLLIRVVSSGMEAWHAEKIRLIWITCALFLFPLTVGDPRRRKMTGCLFKLHAWCDFNSLCRVHVLILFALWEIQNGFTMSLVLFGKQLHALAGLRFCRIPGLMYF